MQVMLVGAGGFVGSALRYVVSVWVQRLAATGGFPYGTLAVNVIGCLLIGLLGGLAEYRQVLNPGQRLFLMVGYPRRVHDIFDVRVRDARAGAGQRVPEGRCQYAVAGGARFRGRVRRDRDRPQPVGGVRNG